MLIVTGRNSTSGDTALTAVVVTITALILGACGIAVMWAQPSAPSHTPRTVFVESGTGSKTSDRFDVATENWSLAWSYDCHGAAVQEPFQLTLDAMFTSVNKFNGKTAQHHARGGRGWVITGTGPSGAGSEQMGGGPAQFYLEIGTPCDWSVKATELGPMSPAQRLLDMIFQLLPVIAVVVIAGKNAQRYAIAIPWLYWTGSVLLGAAYPIQNFVDRGGVDIALTAVAAGFLAFITGMSGSPFRFPKKRTRSDLDS